MINLSIDSFNFGIYQCGPEWLVDEKNALFHRLYYVYQGDATFKSNGKNISLKKDHIYLFPVNKPYTISHDASNPFKCLFFHVTTYPLILNEIIEINTLEVKEVYHLIKILEYLVCDKKKYGINFINRVVEDLIFLIERNENFTFLQDDRVETVLDYIHKNYGKKIYNNELASLAGFDYAYFIRLFEKTLGDTPQKYIAKYRLSKSLNFIREKMSLKEVAEKVGYEDVKVFCRAFKKHNGCTPAEYRKSHFLIP